MSKINRVGIRLVSPLLLLLVFISSAAPVAAEWERVVHDKRLPAELRVVNEGLTHDDESWLMSNKHMLYRAHKRYITIEASNHDAIPDELKEQGFNHIGDIDYKDGILYGGLETSDKRSALARWNSTDLTWMSSRLVDQRGGVPWIAVDKTQGLLYSAGWSEADAINVYDLDTFDPVGRVPAAAGTRVPAEVQGGAFWSEDPNGLYLATNGGCSVYRFDVVTGETEFILSDDYDKRRHEYEMEGLTFWDLGEGVDGGQMHMFGNFMEVKEKSIHSYRHKR